MVNHVFISYSRSDTKYAQNITQHLRAAGLEIWIDSNIEYGERWFKSIVKAVEESSCVLVIMTPQAERSEWVEKEILLAIKYKKPLFPILLKGQVFDILITHQLVDVTNGQLPPDLFNERLSNLVSNSITSAKETESVSHNDIVGKAKFPRVEYSDFPVGSVLIDVITLQNSVMTLQSRVWNDLQVLSLANFVESLVLFEELLVDQQVLEQSGFDYHNSSISSFVKPLLVTESDRSLANITAREIAKTVDINRLMSSAFELYPALDWELSVSSGYWMAEGGTVLTSLTNPQGIDSGKHKSAYGAGMIDCALRAWYYLGLSLQKKIPYVPNDFRALFLNSTIGNQNTAKVIFEKLQTLFVDTLQSNSDWLNEPYPVEEIQLPLIFNYVVSHANQWRDVIPIALEVRESRPARNFRNLCKELDNLRREGRVSQISELIKELNSSLEQIKQGDHTKNKSMKLTFPFLSFLSSRTANTKPKELGLIFLRQIFDGTRDPRYIANKYRALQ